MPHETEAGIACDHVTLDFGRQDGRQVFLQIAVQRSFRLHISTIRPNFKRQEEALFNFFCMKESLGPHVEKVYSVEMLLSFVLHISLVLKNALVECICRAHRWALKEDNNVDHSEVQSRN